MQSLRSFLNDCVRQVWHLNSLSLLSLTWVSCILLPILILTVSSFHHPSTCTSLSSLLILSSSHTCQIYLELRNSYKGVNCQQWWNIVSSSQLFFKKKVCTTNLLYHWWKRNASTYKLYDNENTFLIFVNCSHHATVGEITVSIMLETL